MYNTDYPTHGRKVGKVDQSVIESHNMPEHVTISDNTGSNNMAVTDYPTLQPSGHPPSKPRYRERKRVHAYEQIEEAFIQDGQPVQPVYPDILPSKVNTLKLSVKRNDQWSPGLQKHQKVKVKYEKVHAKNGTMHVDRAQVNQEKAERKRPGSSRNKKSSVSVTEPVHAEAVVMDQQRAAEKRLHEGGREWDRYARRGSRDSRDSRDWSSQDTGVSV